MKIFIAGNRDDTAGFALAGVEPITPEQLAQIDREDAVVIVSSDIALPQLPPFAVLLPEP